ncbi:MAG: TonB-dependent receptor [Opitutus sp.]|nr:TonB-dependent receptor [Opitutus sp.]
MALTLIMFLGPMPLPMNNNVPQAAESIPRSSTRSRWLPLARMTMAFALVSLPDVAMAQTAVGPTEGVVELSPFAVNATGAKGYRARESLSGAGIATDIKDLPIATSVLTREFLQDSLVGQFNEALDYTTSVRQTSRSEIVARRSLFTVRGFATPELMINGVRANENIPSNLIERIEVVKGPNALYGESDPGGLINVMLIQPLYQDRVEFSQKAGSYGFLSTGVDANVVSVDQRLRLRLVGELEKFDGWRRNPADHTQSSYGVSASYALSKRVSIALYGSRLQFNGEQAVRGAFPFNEITPQDLNGDGDFNDTIEGISESRIRRNSPFLPRTFTSNTDDSYIDRASDFF